jgi:toxin FitB
MSLLKYLADTNVISAEMAGDSAVLQWHAQHPGQVAISTLTLAEIRHGIEIKPDGKARRELEKKFQFLLENYEGCVWVFDEAAAMEWGRLMAEARKHNHPLPYGDSLIGAIARSMNVKILSADKDGFPGCHRVDPWTSAEYQSW